MYTIANLHHYQHRAINHILHHPGAMLWLSMGLGKTVAALTAFCALRAFGQVNKMLVVAPLRVAETVWDHEVNQWSHTRHLKCVKILGPPKKRLAALHSIDADIFMINYENLEWLVEQLEHFYILKGRPLPFQLIVWDEVSKMKTSTTNRGKAARKILSLVHRKIGLTGTPASNGLMDLHGQYLVVDGGQRLGTHISHFRNRFMFQESWSHKWLPFPEAQKTIESLIHDITLQMNSEDYLELPPFTINDVYIDLPPKLRASYVELETDMITQFENEHGPQEIVVFNAAALSNKCLQFANGSVYKEPGSLETDTVHSLKLKALDEIVEGSAGENILVAYSFKADLKRIMTAYPHAVNLSGMTSKKLVKAVEDWNAGKIRLLIGHPASMGHGLNLQHGGHTLVWYGLNWSLDLTDQFNARINRQGQKFPVICHRIMIRDTIEGVVKKTLEDKCHTETQLKQAIAAYAAKKHITFI